MEESLTQKELLDAEIGNLGSEIINNSENDEKNLEEKIGEKARVFVTKKNKDFEDVDARADSLSYQLGWTDLPKSELGLRTLFYPEDWTFRIKPAGVEAIKNWSTIDEENPNSIDEVFNEILKNCFSIRTSSGEIIKYTKLNSWDRFWVILKIREYSMPKGEVKIEYHEDCSECDKDVPITLAANTLSYTLPDEDIITKYWNRDEGYWFVNPEEYDVKGKAFKFYNPTIEKDAAIKEWIFKKLQQKKKLQDVFIKFLLYLLPKVSKDEKTMDQLVSRAQAEFEMWNEDQFILADDILRNIMIMPAKYLVVTCPHCGEEVHSDIRFPNGVKSILDVQNRRKKFGTK